MKGIKFDEQSELEKLLQNINDFRESRDFYDRLVFVKQSRYLAPYNAFLVTQQKKNATFVLSEDKWKDLGRYPKEGASPIVIMIPFGPVQFVYDLEDTEGKPLKNYNPNIPISSLMESIFPWQGDFTPLKNVYHIIGFNARQDGLTIEEKPLEPELAGQAFTLGSDEKKKDKKLLFYGVTVNTNHPEEIRLPTLVHELAHIFCGHLDKDKQAFYSDLGEKEFEAESVAYLFCYRKGFAPKSEKYLVNYLRQGWRPPLGMFDNILKALRKIEKLAEAQHPIDPGKCKNFEFMIRYQHGVSYSISSSDCKAILYKGGRNRNHQEIKPTPKQWKSFWQTCGNIGVGLWASQYTNSYCKDGIFWELKLDCQEFTVQSEGFDAYPTTYKAYEEYYEEVHGFPRIFIQLLKAAKRLAGGMDFPTGGIQSYITFIHSILGLFKRSSNFLDILSMHFHLFNGCINSIWQNQTQKDFSTSSFILYFPSQEIFIVRPGPFTPWDFQ